MKLIYNHSDTDVDLTFASLSGQLGFKMIMRCEILTKIHLP